MWPMGPGLQHHRSGSKQIAVIDVGEGPICLINPKLSTAKGKRSMWKGA